MHSNRDAEQEMEAVERTHVETQLQLPPAWQKAGVGGRLPQSRERERVPYLKISLGVNL